MNTMSYVFSANLEGLNASSVRVEVNIKRGIPRFCIVGLADASIREAVDRVRIAIENSGYEFPLQNILVNLAPAGHRKEGSWFDLSIALAILIVTEQIDLKIDLEKFLFLGELGLDGSIKPMKGLINVLFSIEKDSFSFVVIPSENRFEASLAKHLNIYCVSHLNELKQVLSGNKPKEEVGKTYTPVAENLPTIQLYNDQLLAMRALMIAVAGRHHLLMLGNPGAGKTMLAKLASTLQPPATEEEYLEILRIKSNAELILNEKSLLVHRPFRSPHHTASDISIVGGGRDLRMGEVTLAHNGILFLDELGEFKPQVIQVLREPMEEGKITISRVSGHYTYPASFLLISATNPCPCGYFGSNERQCLCSISKVKKYVQKFSGPFMDRIDLEVELNIYKNDSRKQEPVNLSEMYDKIVYAKEMQDARYKQYKYNFNGMVNGADMENFFLFDGNTKGVWDMLKVQLSSSIRKLNIIKKVARTIADLEKSELIKENHIFEALSYRSFQNYLVKLAA
ncbi:MAG: YifB family Mg chelatase-like AAA ATPase [Leptospiraceae bacterium]|nr:YifB family Mg chelatase-like AAA ATPase [Leptospiraceae bacterium]